MDNKTENGLKTDIFFYIQSLLQLNTSKCIRFHIAEVHLTVNYQSHICISFHITGIRRQT